VSSPRCSLAGLANSILSGLWPHWPRLACCRTRAHRWELSVSAEAPVRHSQPRQAWVTRSRYWTWRRPAETRRTNSGSQPTVSVTESWAPRMVIVLSQCFSHLSQHGITWLIQTM
jgi:hypothetical protein